MDKAFLTGGLLAAAVAGWSQLKSLATYLSSFVVIKVTVDESLKRPLERYIRHNWKPLPTGLLLYRGFYLAFKGESHTHLVPFKIPNATAVFVKGFRVVFVTAKASTTELRFLRGTIDPNKLIERAVTEDHDINMANDAAYKNSRYQVVLHMGREKGQFSMMGNEATSMSPASVTSLESSSYMPGVDSSRDKSFMYDSSNWIFDTKENPFKSLYFPPHIQAYVEQAKQWLVKGDWYAERSIPWRRGWLLHGQGGTGKTSLARAVAQQLGIPVHQFYLSTLSDQEFVRAWSSMAMPCMALLEDFDSVFNKREATTEHKSLTFDCVLNQISGINSGNGIMLVITTNHLEKIDPAMGIEWGTEGAKAGISTRPGRIDTVIEVGNLNEDGRRQMAARILQDWPKLIPQLVIDGADTTPAQFQEMCLQQALTKMQEEETDESTKRWLARHAAETADSFKYG